MSGFITHHGVQGMKWGVRKERNAAMRSEKKDLKWVRKKGEKITNKAWKSVNQKMIQYEKELQSKGMQLRNKSGKLSLTYVNEYNKKVAELMNKQIGEVKAPSGKVLKFIAKRGELGIHKALADQGYNMDLVKKGVNSAGRIAYKKEVLRKE